MSCVTYFPTNALFIIDSISILVDNSNFTSVIFKAACHANAGAERNFPGPKC